MKRITLLYCALGIFLIVGCVASQSFRSQPTLIPLNTFTASYEFITNEVVDSLTEISLLSSAQLQSELFKVGYIPEDNVVLGVYRDRGTVAGWNIDKSTLAFTHELGIVTAKDLTFTTSGKNVVGAMDHVFKPNGLNQNIEYLNGIALWDVRTGALLKCITYPCQGNSGELDGFLGYAVDANGKWSSTFSEGLIDIIDESDNTILFTYEINAIDSSYHWRIGSVDFDEVNDRYVIVFQEGRIYVDDIERPFFYRTLASGNKGDYGIVTEAIIDPTGRWLAVARGDKTQVLNLNNGKSLLEINVSDPVLSFDQTGELLFVGSANKMAIYSIVTSEKIAEYDTVGITSLAISEDNRLVIWGDEKGAIHVWGNSLLAP